ncbi:16S rRNA methyltransferase [Loigolactobacillus coryniformis subsp. coryniformis]|uniref:Ribosomal RNA small subunit methyltransferase A n=1 Tax=Loigolactobacillus coryniformis subsp. coryniformis KCTC 3167 = DSM 20001 TaxID=913848 RepID=A0A0R1F7H6_9LACO|nr:16S rRNA (adenine(1518)-N(6)/adenine(1519)-N(6))-dimethyltransferase RsmA [Loigolactobacillus coryniformis]ATO54568.1 16S rRNA (adenine(1518)-N(6)/adenine(1519)-N(6))-dimethyltransferase [Loigolactobacillus coryniformis subsp. coryniformis KCTC 3167 = DSM 20001]KRK15204.1 16S ribosomal RNA methyltransferase KsgA Dim1 family protein [Loigolactobacillus coryniformis subsp. coryniformis KCTC 3167 = DSM 20001]OEH90064.1 16S rRNA methyltransferase [Loigolactobacillus coryniformis subsp. coryniform
MTEEQKPIGSRERTREILAAYGLTFKKSLGQNFLTEPTILRQIASAAELTTADDVLEIGPGIGSLTEQLAQNAHQVLALEIDQRLLPILADTLAPYDNVTVLNQDVLKSDLATLIREHFDGQHKVKVVANLPYYITTPILLRLLESGVAFDQIVVMMQKEVAERLAAAPGSKAYGSLSVAVQYQMTVKLAFIVPKTVFVPQPNVDSAIVSLTRHVTPPAVATDEKVFARLVRGSFAQRRKSLWNNLTALYGKDATTKAALTEVLAAEKIDPGIRGERLSVTDFVRLANAISDHAKL